MRDATVRIHQEMAALGTALGFVVGREVSDSLLRLRVDEAYRPRIDLLWSVPLDPPKCQAIAWVLERELDDVTHLPVVGIEVEGTTPTTKTMQADVANLAALGVPLGLLVVTERGEKNIYRRAVRVVRSVRRSFGDLHLLPMEAEWLARWSDKSWPSGIASVPVPKRQLPAGGETLEWSETTRKQLRSLGERAGFIVAEPYIPPVLSRAFGVICGQRKNPLTHTCDPINATMQEMRKWDDLYTGSKIDLAWLMPLPQALPCLLEEILRLDSCLREDAIIFPELWSHVPVVAFELESSHGKHAGGGLLNLSAYGVLGIAVAPDRRVGSDILAALQTYRPALGLRNVHVRVIQE
jgi:hypothetical protein